VNLPKIVEALEDLNFYEFKYTVVLTESYNKNLRDAELLGHIIETDLNVMFRKGDRTFNCMKSFSAVDDETANNKITEWLDSKINKGEISSYVIDSMKFNTFYEELEERNLDKLFVKEKGTL
jgi:rhamnogalacturonyl hydrolase YesR